jgi:hypothetical protein
VNDIENENEREAVKFRFPPLNDLFKSIPTLSRLYLDIEPTDDVDDLDPAELLESILPERATGRTVHLLLSVAAPCHISKSNQQYLIPRENRRLFYKSLQYSI